MTNMRSSGLRGWSVRCASIVLSVAFCASAFAGAGSDAQPKKAVQKTAPKGCLVFAGSGIPENCDRFTGPIPTTAYPIEILGKAY